MPPSGAPPAGEQDVAEFLFEFVESCGGCCGDPSPVTGM